MKCIVWKFKIRVILNWIYYWRMVFILMNCPVQDTFGSCSTTDKVTSEFSRRWRLEISFMIWHLPVNELLVLVDRKVGESESCCGHGGKGEDLCSCWDQTTPICPIARHYTEVNLYLSHSQTLYWSEPLTGSLGHHMKEAGVYFQVMIFCNLVLLLSWNS
jgi:hypothetical protein